MKIGLALSGGGVRAIVFHLGVLKRIAETPRWQDITFLSTVSGGSLCVALVFEKSGKSWPTAKTFSETCLPEIKQLLTSYDLEGEYKRIIFARPWMCFSGRASLIAKLIRKRWGITSSISQIPDLPRWQICATCYETGKNWRFSKTRMGDYLTHYVVSPDFPLAEAVSASAAVPGLIGPLHLKTSKFRWHKYAKDGIKPDIEVKPIAPSLTLWDGGVYENLGVEAMFKPQTGLREEVDFLIISDASKPLGIQTRRLQWGIPPYLPPFRLIDIATDQVRAFRLRTIVGFFNQNKTSGAVLRMGNSVADIFRGAKMQMPIDWSSRKFLAADKVRNISEVETSLRKLTEVEYDALIQHGYEVAEATLRAYEHVSFAVV